MKVLLAIPLILLELIGFSPVWQAQQEKSAKDSLFDLSVKGVSYRSQNPSYKNYKLKTFPLKLTYELRILIENKGLTAFRSPFYLSYSASVEDYRDHLFTKFERLNEEAITINPGETHSFIVIVDFEFLRQPVPRFLSVRCVIGADRQIRSYEITTWGFEELDYENNLYEFELSLSR